MTDLRQLFLNELEEIESKYLSWGYVEGSFTLEELDKLATEFLSRHSETDMTVEDLRNGLIEKWMIAPLPGRKGEVFRTRMAETVRLMARLRQWFPSKTWQASPTLVSDFRFHQRTREYPTRFIDGQDLLQEANGVLESFELDALKTYMDGKGSGFQLSEFQRDATIRMFKNLQTEKSCGFIITAGTGTGKTLAFYLPALTWIASRIDSKRWTKAVALYPRNELLKDQFMDTLKEVLVMNESFNLDRAISIGALFGDTPSKIDKVPQMWKKGAHGYLCPFLKCPKCNSEMVWPSTDLANRIERLVCVKRGCGNTIDSDVMPLTRASMRNNPPDIMFTTTEMMNRYMSDHNYGSLIGIRTSNPPRIVLLDEAHTYTGTHGAQVALLLRRWRHAIGETPLHFTGLSATLRDAGDFFSQLTGLSRSHVSEIEAGNGKKETKGKEYQLVLRGDPASGTSLLSTTIQAAMLLRRMLDTTSSSRDEGVKVYGSKLFLFTDDLDVTNRMFHTLLDAEGRNSKTLAKLLDREPLAALRSSYNKDAPQRMLYGQSWQFSENIGHDLMQPLQIGRTSSQDTGVDAKAEVIVSSPSLEVGFNDKLVGAVIQHKAPRDLAAFLQRKGRAGRDPLMRPWMVTVLSDYGRDRFMYQSYDTLFQPVLERQALPIMNRYVLRIQAVFAFMDWVAYELDQQRNRVGSLWYLFAQPSEENIRQQNVVAVLIKRVLEEDTTRTRLEMYLKKALNCSQENIDALMWDPPRSLMLEVLPTLLRRLKTNWASMERDRVGNEMYTPNHPLPEFVPANLFSDLSLPEVKVVLPSQQNAQPSEEPMDILQALNTFAPGRVSRRFGVTHGGESHWIAPPSLQSNGELQELNISAFCTNDDYRHLGMFEYYDQGLLIQLPVIRPLKIRPVQTERGVDTKSNARLLWKSQLFPASEVLTSNNDYGRKADIPKGTRWASVISEIRFFTHDTHSAVAIRRFAIGSEASVRLTNESEATELSVRFCTEPNKPAALGFTQQVDGIRFELHKIPETVISKLDRNTAKLRSFRSLYFQYLVENDEKLNEYGNAFVLGRMAEIYLSALLHIAMVKNSTIAEACETIHENSFSEIMNRVMNVVFQVLPNTDESEFEEEAQYQRTHIKLISLFEMPLVGERLKMLAVALWEDIDEQWQHWARQRWVTTLGEALLQACIEMAGSHRNGDLLLDIGGGPRKNADGTWENTDNEIWISETIEGGSGIVEEIANGYQQDPRRFFRLVESALTPSDAEIVHSELSRVIELIQDDAIFRETIERFRNASGYQETNVAIEQVKSQMQHLGILTTLPVMNGLFNRLLRPGSNPQTDRFLFEMHQMWKEEEIRLGVEMDARVFAYVCSTNERKTEEIRNALQHIDPRAQEDVNWRFNVVYGMIWPQGSQIRRRALESYNPFVSGVPTDRELVLDSMQLHHRVLYTDTQWKERMTEILIAHGAVQLLVPHEQKLEMSDVIVSLTAEPLDLGYLHVYPRVEGISRERDVYVINFEIREAMQ